MAGTRRAIALLILGFYVTQFAMTSWLGPGELFACYLALSLVYGLAFIALAAEWFWARWFAIGIGNFGSLFLLVLFKIGMEPIIAFVGGTHLLVTLLLLGEGMAARYEHSEATEERWHFHEETLVLMRRAVKSAGSTLPLLILYALAPRPEFLQLAALGLGLAGLVGLLRARTWGIFALGGAGVLALVDGLGLVGTPPVGYLFLTPKTLPFIGGLGTGFGTNFGTWGGAIIYGPIVGLLAAGLILVPLVFARPLARALLAPR